MGILIKGLFFLNGLGLGLLLLMPMVDPATNWDDVFQGSIVGLCISVVWGGLSLAVPPQKVAGDELLKAIWKRRWGLVVGGCGLIFCGVFGPLVNYSGPEAETLGWIVTAFAIFPLVLFVSSLRKKPDQIIVDSLATDGDYAPFPDGGLAPPPGTDLDDLPPPPQ